jgi:UbiD family decarboxylase
LKRDRTTLTHPDYDRFRLRTFLDALARLGELELHAEPFKLADAGRVLEGNPKAVLFESIGAERQALAGNVLGSRKRMAHAFGVAPQALLAEVRRRLRNQPEIVEVARREAPVQHVVLTGAEADLTALPVHLQHG